LAHGVNGASFRNQTEASIPKLSTPDRMREISYGKVIETGVFKRKDARTTSFEPRNVSQTSRKKHNFPPFQGGKYRKMATETSPEIKGSGRVSRNSNQLVLRNSSRGFLN